MSKCILRTALVVLALASAHQPGQCLVMTHHGGLWPSDWPAELEPLRGTAITIDVGTGRQERIYEITFESSEDFIKAWPALLKVRTPGSPLRLRQVSSSEPEKGSWESIASNSKPKVRIFAPISDTSRTARVADYGTDKPTPGMQPKMLPFTVGPPWPQELLSREGGLPEYVHAIPMDGKAVLVAVKSDERPRGFGYRTRVDIELVVDGKLIDLNRIEFPKDILIMDHRFEVQEPK
jgi:hypothetical protein